MTTGRIAELVSIAVALGGCLVWVGSTAGEVKTTKERVNAIEAKAQALPTQVAVLQTQMTAVQETQRKQDEKLDKILEEVRRR